MTANIIPSDPLKLKNQAKLLAGLRDQVRNLQNGIAERDVMIAERDKRIAELEAKLDHVNEERFAVMNRIKELRQIKNVTLDKVSEKTGINRATLSRYENGNSEPKAEGWHKLAQYFNVTIGYLMGYEE